MCPAAYLTGWSALHKTPGVELSRDGSVAGGGPGLAGYVRAHHPLPQGERCHYTVTFRPHMRVSAGTVGLTRHDSTTVPLAATFSLTPDSNTVPGVRIWYDDEYRPQQFTEVRAVVVHADLTGTYAEFEVVVHYKHALPVKTQYVFHRRYNLPWGVPDGHWYIASTQHDWHQRVHLRCE